jgi:hypothetical protein
MLRQVCGWLGTPFKKVEPLTTMRLELVKKVIRYKSATQRQQQQSYPAGYTQPFSNPLYKYVVVKRTPVLFRDGLFSTRFSRFNEFDHSLEAKNMIMAQFNQGFERHYRCNFRAYNQAINS